METSTLAVMLFSKAGSYNCICFTGKPVDGANENERSGEVLNDAWILDVKQITWTKVSPIYSVSLATASYYSTGVLPQGQW